MRSSMMACIVSLAGWRRESYPPFLLFVDERTFEKGGKARTRSSESRGRSTRHRGAAERRGVVYKYASHPAALSAAATRAFLGRATYATSLVLWYVAEYLVCNEPRTYRGSLHGGSSLAASNEEFGFVSRGHVRTRS